MSIEITSNKEYKNWLAGLKTKVRTAQLKAAVRVNKELLTLYWELGADIISKQSETKWGDKFLQQLSKDLAEEFPEIKGFSERNLKYIRQWYSFYASTTNAFGQQPVAQIAKQLVLQSPTVSNSQQTVDLISQQAVPLITQIPWGHNIAIIAKCKNIEEALFYIQNTIEHGWSRSVLIHQIESGLFRREGSSVNNFALTLPAPQSDLAKQTIKDPYVFDFLSMTKDYNERDLESALVEHLTHFLLELGAGFAYLGRQIQINVGEREFFLDLLFYHTRLHCYVVVELKTGEFEPEFAGKLNFYIKAVDKKFRNERDQPTIGILLCKKKDRLVAEYALSDIHKPIGVSEYQLTQSLPDNLKPSLPSIEEIEREFDAERQ
ncbi:MAG: PDDEXK nuclease domain-containing protein [Melioribacteraceae bacterium]